jgi:Transposase
MEEILCGIDWASDHHDVVLIDAEGARLGRRRISGDAAGLGELAALFAAPGVTQTARLVANHPQSTATQKAQLCAL